MKVFIDRVSQLLHTEDMKTLAAIAIATVLLTGHGATPVKTSAQTTKTQEIAR